MIKNLRANIIKGLQKAYDFYVEHPRFIFGLSMLLILSTWLITRLPYFLYYPIPSIQPDYSSYVEYVWNMSQGKIPSFSYRTPGYPLFMALVLVFSKKLMSIVLVQHLISLFAAVTMAYASFKSFRILTPIVAIGIAAFISSNTQVQVDMTLLTESLYTNFLIISMALIILALKTKRLRYLALTSTCMALSIYIRPTGQFFFVTFGMILVFLLINKFSKKQMLAFVAPFISLMILLPCYNYISYGRFNITNGKEITLICGASFFIEQNPNYSNELNKVIASVRGRFSKEDRDTVETSWDFDKIYSSYYKNDYWRISDILRPFTSTPEAKKIGINKTYEIVAMNSIKNNFPIFFKLFLMNLQRYFINNITFDYNFYGSTLPISYDLLIEKRNYMSNVPDEKRKIVLREFFDPKKYDYFTKDEAPNGYKISIVSTPLQRIHESFTKFHQKNFRTEIWAKALLGLCLLSLILVALTRCKNADMFIMLILTSAAFGHGIISSIFANVPRFSAPTQFLYYISVALIPILFTRFISLNGKPRNKSLETS